MYKRIFLMIILLLIICEDISFAEKPIANEYRKIFKSGNFYVEFKDNYTTRAISEFNGKRLERTIYDGTKIAIALNPLGAIFGGSSPKNPDTMYDNGKYYQFIEKNIAIMLPESQLNNENLNPREGWSNVRQKLALPNELAMFYWEDSYRGKSTALNMPKFLNSSRKNIGKKEYDCDRYISTIKTIDNNIESRLIYDVLYEDEKIIEIHSYIFQNNIEYPVNILKIKRIEGVIPKDAFKIEKNTKIYAAGVGDMDDLLENSVQVDAIGGNKK